jgi:hypothetical protein
MKRVFDMNKNGVITIVENVVEKGTIAIDGEPKSFTKAVTRKTSVDYATVLKNVIDITQEILEKDPQKLIDACYDMVAPYVKAYNQIERIADVFVESDIFDEFNRKNFGIFSKILWRICARTNRKSVPAQKTAVKRYFEMLGTSDENSDSQSNED